MKSPRSKTTKIKRPKKRTPARRRISSVADLQRLLDQRTRELAEALEQQKATSQVLQVIASSPAELEPVFEAMLANATRICEANFGFMYLYQGGAFFPAAAHNTPAALAEHRP